VRTVIFIGLAAAALGGCAAQTLSIRNLPPETPAADNAAAIKKADALAAATKAASVPGAQDSEHQAVPLTTADAPSMYSYDPWERMNRFMYRFNARFDESIFLPVVYEYEHLPSPLRSGVHNFFENLDEVKSIINYLAQLHPAAGAKSLGRFVINSTLGIGGLFDVAAKLKLESEPTGLSTTLSRWGVHPGPYLVLPIFGPSTLRDSVGLLGDFGVSYEINIFNLYRGDKTWAFGVINAVDQRSNTSFRYYSTGSPFEYETVRFLYVHRELIEDDAQHAQDQPKRRDMSTPAGK
jgi:phospholipid-binding lipoprotein MlaA